MGRTGVGDESVSFESGFGTTGRGRPPEGSERCSSAYECIAVPMCRSRFIVSTRRDSSRDRCNHGPSRAHVTHTTNSQTTISAGFQLVNQRAARATRFSIHSMTRLTGLWEGEEKRVADPAAP